MKAGDTVYVLGKYEAMVIAVYKRWVKVFERKSICGNCRYCNFGKGLTYPRSLIKIKKRENGVR